MPITCFIRYQIDPFQRGERSWLEGRGLHSPLTPPRRRRRGPRAGGPGRGGRARRLGIRLFDGLMAANGLQPVSNGYALTDSGRAWLLRLGFEAPDPGRKRRYAYACLDWSERRDHLAGELADQLYRHLVAQGWVRRGAGRDVAVTLLGQRVLVSVLGRDDNVAVGYSGR